jgi:hypothetical protein
LQRPERLFFGLQIGLDVHVSGVQAFMGIVQSIFNPAARPQEAGERREDLRAAPVG